MPKKVKYASKRAKEFQNQYYYSLKGHNIIEESYSVYLLHRERAKIEKEINLSEIKRADNLDKFYNAYKIKKSSGDTRTVCAPVPWLKKLQNCILDFAKTPPCSQFAAAYERGASTKANAIKHSGARHILHIDIKDFFPSISFKIFESVYAQYFTVEELQLLWKLVSYNGGIAIGAPTSPFIANRILYEFDKRMQKITRGMTYTRYADDIIVSSKKFINAKLIDKIYAEIKKTGFIPSPEKTYFMSYRKEVTGIIINDRDNSLSTGTHFKKELKKAVYDLLVKKKGNIDIARGKLAYLRYVEPNYALVIENKYKSLDNIGLFGGNNKNN